MVLRSWFCRCQHCWEVVRPLLLAHFVYNHKKRREGKGKEESKRGSLEERMRRKRVYMLLTLDDTRKTGLVLTLLGFLFMFLGVLLFCDRGLLHAHPHW